MTTEKTAVTEFFKPRFQKLGFSVIESTIYSNEIRIYVINDSVKMCVIDDLREILDWNLYEIGIASGGLVFIYV